MMITNRNIHIHWHHNLKFHDVPTFTAMRTSDITDVLFLKMIWWNGGDFLKKDNRITKYTKQIKYLHIQ
jgi:hypothetical protein